MHDVFLCDSVIDWRYAQKRHWPVVVLLYVHINELVGLLEKYGVKVNALVIRRTVLHDDLSVLAIRRTTQMNSRPTEAKWRFARVMSLISTNQTTYESYGED